MDELLTWGLLGLGAYFLLKGKGSSGCTRPTGVYQSYAEKGAQAIQTAFPGSSIGEVCMQVMVDEHDTPTDENVDITFEVFNAPTGAVSLSAATLRDTTVASLAATIKDLY